MTITAAAIQAQLVDVRNLGTEKCIKMTLHVPAEQAMKVLEAFGWPTAVNPVPVALARLNPSNDFAGEAPGPSTHAAVKLPRATVSPRGEPAPEQPRPVKASGGAKSWHEMGAAAQAGVLCNDKSFWLFLAANFSSEFTREEHAAIFVRNWCGVESRKLIFEGSRAIGYWRVLVSDYRAWMREPEVVGS